MSIAKLLMNNKVVRLQGTDYVISNSQYSIEGKLFSFTVGTSNYIYTNSFQIENKIRQGYCNTTILEQYKNKLIEGDVFIKKENWFDDIFELAKVGDTFEIEKVDFYNASGGRDFVHYYSKFKYVFKIAKLTIDFFDSSQYPILNPDINSPTYSVKTHIYINLDTSLTGKFYKKNFGDKVAGLQSANVPDKDIEAMAYYMIYICSRIHWILEENLMQVFAINDLATIRTAVIDKYVNSSESGYNALPFIDRIIGELRKDWGIYEIGSNLAVKDFFPVLDINLLYTYYNALSGFYNKITLLEENTLFKYNSNNFPLNDAGEPLTLDPALKVEKDSDRRITKMISLLPSIGFSLFPPQDRLKLLDKALEYSEIYENRPDLYFNIRTPQDAINDLISGNDTSDDLENDALFIEDDIVKLVGSFNTTYAEANLLLDFLLVTKSFDKGASITKYERLYNLINDKGADNIAIINWFISEENNRGRLMLQLYEIWQKSKYFFYSQPPGVAMTENGTNPQNYFLFTPEGNAYYADYDPVTGNVIPNTGSEPLLEFQSVDLKLGCKYLIKYIPEKIEKEKVIVTKKLIIENFASDWIPDALEWGHQIFPAVPFGSYHLYQTISLVGFKIDEDLAAQAPQINLGLVPAFLFHYLQEFDRLKNIYAGISLAIEITLEVGLFFATAGSSSALALRHLRHLRHFTKLGKIKTVTGTLEAGVAASDVLFSFRVAEGAAEITSMTAGVASSYLSYLATVNDNAFQRRLSYFFMAFALASAGGAIYSNRKVVKMADDILNPNLTPTTLLNHLQSTKPAVYNLLLEVAGKKVAFLNDFATRIEDFTEVKNFFNNTLVGTLADLRPKFLEDFGALDPSVLQKLNNSGVLDNWRKLANVDAVYERKLFDFISNTNRTDTLVQFYGINPLKLKIQVLDDAKKITFIDNFKNIDPTDFNKFVSSPDLVTHWFRYFDETILRADFISLTKSKQLKFLEDYGDATVTVFNKFRANKMLIKHWDECHIDFLAYRTEIKFLEELHHFKVKDPNAFDHLAFFKSRPKSGSVSTKFNCTGGHTEIIDFTGLSAHKIMSNNIKILDPLFTHTINTSTTSQRMIDYLNNTLNNTNVGLGKKYSKTPTSNGHFEHRDILFKVDPQPSSLSADWANQWVLNGELYQFKKLHTQYNPLWTEQKIVHDMAFASKNKVLKPSTALNVNPQTKISEHGLNQQWIETTYESRLLDGTNVIIKHVNYHRYNLQTHFNNHYSYFELQ